MPTTMPLIDESFCDDPRTPLASIGDVLGPFGVAGRERALVPPRFARRIAPAIPEALHRCLVEAYERRPQPARSSEPEGSRGSAGSAS